MNTLMWDCGFSGQFVLKIRFVLYKSRVPTLHYAITMRTQLEVFLHAKKCKLLGPKCKCMNTFCTYCRFLQGCFLIN